MSEYSGETLRLTIESKMNGKKVIHNGNMGVYEDFTPVNKDDVKGLEETIKGLYTYLVTHTKHKIYLHTFGVEIQAKGNARGIGQSFVGYDESLDSKLRLCYCKDTFLAMELMGIMYGFTDNKPKPKATKVEQEEPEDVTEQNNDTTEGYNIYGWGDEGKDTIVSKVYESIDKLCARLESLPEVTVKDVQVFRAEVKNIIKGNEEILDKGMPLNNGEPVYRLIATFLEQIGKVFPYVRLREEENNLLLETKGGDIVLNVYDKELGKYRNNGMGIVSITESSPVFKGFRKVIDFLSSNVSYARITAGNEAFKEVEPEVKKETKPTVNKESHKSDKKEVAKVDIHKGLSEQYFNIYLTKAGDWGKKDDKYPELKEIIEGLIRENDIDGVTLRGLDDTEVYIDWVIDNETYTMALTEKATKVKELAMKYDMAIAYDTEFPNIIGVLIKDKLNEVFEKLDN